MKHLAIATAWLLLWISTLAANELVRTGDTRWAVLASAMDSNEAIGIAQVYRWRFPDVRVVESSNGWLAVIGGPVSIDEGAAAAKDGILAAGGVPSDIFLSNGEAFLRTVWVPAERETEIWEYEHGDNLEIVRGDLQFVVSDHFASDYELRIPELTVSDVEGVVSEVSLPQSQTTNANAQLRVAWLDRTSAYPQLLFSSYWMGAHCCTVTKIISEVDGAWEAVDGDTLDGGGGYDIVDVDHDEEFELVSYDNSFLYAFAPYVSSWMPMSIKEFVQGELIDKRWDPQYRRFYAQEIYRLEHLAKLNSALWSENGFLAAWVALKSITGQHDEAWSEMLTRYDRQAGWPLFLCEVEVQAEPCPEGRQRRVGFPEALHHHLELHGYLAPPTSGAPEEPISGTVTAAPAIGEDRPSSASQGAPLSNGTGFFISGDGHFISNYHVISECADVDVRIAGSDVRDASVLASDERNDLALLMVEGSVPHYASIRTQPRLGEQVAAFGYPLSNVLSTSGNFTLGNVTALSGMGDDTRYLQMSTPVQPGNSGGPLVDEFGNVVGVVTAKLDAIVALAVSGDIPQNVNFAIRSSTLEQFISAHGISADAEVNKVKLDTPDLAERAVSISGAVLCR